MSSSVDTEDIVTVSEDDITVTKRYAPEEFPVPAIRFEISSDRAEPVAVRVTEEIPESFPMDAVGFHPEYHSDQWTAYQDHRVQFEGVVEPTDSVVTVYGIRLDDEFDPSAFLTDPTIVLLEANDVVESTAADVSESVEEVVSSDGANAVKDLLSGTSDSVPGLDTDGDSVDDADSAEESIDDVAPEGDSVADTDSVEDPVTETATDESIGSFAEDEPDSGIELDIDAAAERVAQKTDSGGDSAADASDSSSRSDDSVGSSTERGDAVESSDDGMDSTDGESATPKSVSATLAAEIRAGDVDDSDLQTIVDAMPDDVSGSTGVKLNHLQQRVESLAAYTDALEEFLDENGSGSELIEQQSSELEALRSDVEAIEEGVDEHAEEIDELHSSFSSTSSEVDDLESSVSKVESSVASIDDELSDLSDTVSSHDETVDALDERVSGVETSVSDLDGRTESLESDVEDVTTDVDDLSDTVETVADDLDEVSNDVVDIIEWRDQLGSMFTDE